MSELKAYNVVATADVNPDVVDNLGCTEWPAYDKEEADKVIADKDKEIAQLQAMLEKRNGQIAKLIEKNEWLANKDMIMASETIKDVLKQLRHHKYKRCLAMVAYCDIKMSYWAIREIHEGDTGKFELYSKWHKRWLELAKKFKPNN